MSLLCVCPCPFLQGSADEEPEEMPPPDAETVQVIPGSELIWRIAPRPDNSAQVSREKQGRGSFDRDIWSCQFVPLKCTLVERALYRNDLYGLNV